jgi:hypothetical protein
MILDFQRFFQANYLNRPYPVYEKFRLCGGNFLIIEFKTFEVKKIIKKVYLRCASRSR